MTMAATCTGAAVHTPRRKRGAAASSLDDDALPVSVTTPLDALVAAPGLRSLPVDVLKIAVAFTCFTWNMLTCAVPRPLFFCCGAHERDDVARNEAPCDVHVVCITPLGTVVCVDTNCHISVCADRRSTWRALDHEALLAATGGSADSRAIFVSHSGVFCVRMDGVVLVSLYRSAQDQPSPSGRFDRIWIVALRVEGVRDDDTRPGILWAVDASRFASGRGLYDGLSPHVTSGQYAAVACMDRRASVHDRWTDALHVGRFDAHGTLMADVLTLPLLDVYARWDICDAGVVQMCTPRVVLYAWSTGRQLMFLDYAWRTPVAAPCVVSLLYHVACVVTSSGIHLLAAMRPSPSRPEEPSEADRFAVMALDVPMPTASGDVSTVADWREVVADQRVNYTVRCHGVAHVHASGVAVLLPSGYKAFPKAIWCFGCA